MPFREDVGAIRAGNAAMRVPTLRRLAPKSLKIGAAKEGGRIWNIRARHSEFRCDKMRLPYWQLAAAAALGAPFAHLGCQKTAGMVQCGRKVCDMTLQRLIGFLKSNWPFIAIFAAVVLAFVVDARSSNRGAVDEPADAPASAASEDGAVCDGFILPSDECVRETMPYISKGLQVPRSAVEISLSRGRKLQLPSDVYLIAQMNTVFCDPFPAPCPPTPLYWLKRGNSIVEIDFDGNIIDGDDGDHDSFLLGEDDVLDEMLTEFFFIDENDVWDPAAFPFIPASGGD